MTSPRSLGPGQQAEASPNDGEQEEKGAPLETGLMFIGPGAGLDLNSAIC